MSKGWKHAVSTGALAALAGCCEPAALSADGAWVRLPAVQGRPAAAYFTLRGGPADAALVAVGTDAARRTELHETAGGRMRPIASAAIPAGAEVAFAPGGKHVMLFDLDPRVAPGRPVRLRLSFADGRTLTVSARAVAAGDPAP